MLCLIEISGKRSLSSGECESFSERYLGSDPGHKDKVLNYVLGKPSVDEGIDIQRSIDNALSTVPTMLTGELQKVMKVLHTEK